MHDYLSTYTAEWRYYNCYSRNGDFYSEIRYSRRLFYHYHSYMN